MTLIQEKNGLIDYFIKIVEFLLAITIIFDCNSIYSVMRFGVSPLLLTVFGANIFAGLLIFLWIIKDKSNKTCIRNHKLLFLVSFVFVFFFFGVNAAYNDNVGYWGYFLFFMNFMVILYNIYRKNHDTFRLLFVIERIMIVLSVVSVILWVGSSVLELWGMGEDVFVSWGGKYYNANYLNLCIRRWNISFSADIKKNLGVFCEPPMFGLMLGFSIYTEMFLKKRSNLLILIVLFGALLSSRAILGLMICAIAVFFKFVEILEGKKHEKLIISAVLIAATALIIGLALFKMGKENESFRTHIDDFIAAFKCWTNYPLFGCGYGNKIPITEFMSDFRSGNLGVSNSIAVVLAEGGLVLWLYYVIPFAFMIASFFKKNKKTAYWAIGMLCFWIGVVFHFKLLIFIILALGYSMIDLRVIEDEKHKKRVSCLIKWFDENNSEDGDFFEKQPLNIPFSIGIVATTILFLSSVYTIVNAAIFEITDITCAVVVIIGTMVLIVINRKINKFVVLGIEAAFWALFMSVGHLYKVLDSIYIMLGLYIQDKWWTSLVAVVLVYVFGAAVQMIIDNKRLK